jgi:endonuclease/exonuclease/phosphatase family metal-dependent hydrolase
VVEGAPGRDAEEQKVNADALVRRVALAGLTLVVLCGCASYERSDSTRTLSHARTAHELRVMTFNLRVRMILDGHNIWDKRRDLVVERVRAFDADLLGTQEGLDSMETYLRQQLGDYTFRGVGRDDGKQRGEMCGVFFKTARFELLDGGYFWLSKTPEKPGSRGWAEVYPRMVTWVKLRPRAGGAPFYWFNTHFDAYSPWARAQSSKLLRDRIAHIAGAMPCIVTGDFNTGPGSTPYRTLLAPQPTTASSLHDVFRAAHPVATRDEGTVHFFTGRRGGRRMDWILASSYFQTIDAEIDHTRGSGGYPSDHFPVTATLRGRAPTAPQPQATQRE